MNRSTTDFFEIAHRDLLEPTALTDNELERVLGSLSGAALIMPICFFRRDCGELVVGRRDCKRGSYHLTRV